MDWFPRGEGNGDKGSNGQEHQKKLGEDLKYMRQGVHIQRDNDVSRHRKKPNEKGRGGSTMLNEQPRALKHKGKRGELAT